MAKSTIVTVYNSTGSTIVAGSVVYISGVDAESKLPTIELADNRNDSTMPAIGILREDLEANEQGIVKITGAIASLDTSSAAINDNVYVGTNGGITFTDPGDNDNASETLSQQLGTVTASAEAPNGQVHLFPLEVKRKIRHEELIDVEDDQHHLKLHEDDHRPHGLDPFIHANHHQPQGGDPFFHTSQHAAGGLDELNHSDLAGLGLDNHTHYSLVDGTRAFTGTVGGIDPILATDLATKNYVDISIVGEEFRSPILDKDLSAPPGGSSLGDRYIVDGAGSGDWAGQGEKIAQFNGSTWDFTAPDEGYIVWVADEDALYGYTDTHPAGTWIAAGSGGSISGSGVAGQAAFWSSASSIDGDNDFFWDDTNKRLGIGTTSPSQLLTVESSTTSEAKILVNSDWNTAQGSFHSGLQLEQEGTFRGGIFLDTSTLQNINIWDGTAIRLTVEQGGDVGIGTQAPLAPLHVVGTNAAGLQVDGEDGSSIRIIGNIASHGVMGVPSGIIKAPNNRSLAIELSTNTATDRFGIVTDPSLAGNGVVDTEVFTVTAQGNVGIGVTAPTEDLEIAGALKIGAATGTASGTIRWTGTDFEGRVSGVWASLTGAGGSGASSGVSGSVQFADGASGFLSDATNFFWDDTNDRLGIGTNTPTNQLHISSTGDASILIEADSDDATETDNVWLLLRQDGGLTETIFGLVGATNVDPSGAAYTGTVHNDTLIGTKDSAGRLKFGVNNDVKMTIEQTGYVAIGPTDPTSMLHVEGSTVGDGGDFDGLDSIVHIKQNTSWSGNQPWALFVEGYSYLNGFRINAADGIRALHKTAAGGTLGFSTTGDDPITFTQSISTERMRIAAGGNVGIGTSSPSTKLDVVGDIHIGGATRQTSIGNGSDIGFNRNVSSGAIFDSSHNAFQIHHDGGSSAYLSFQIYNTSGGQTDDKAFVITSDGDIGIGTLAPNSEAQLEVETSTSSVINITNTSSSITDYSGLVFRGRSSSGTDIINSYIRYKNTINDPKLLFAVGNNIGIADGNDGFVMTKSGSEFRMGVGTTDPLHPLSVAGNVTVGSTYASAGTNNANGMNIEGNVTIGLNQSRTADFEIYRVGTNLEVSFHTNITAPSLRAHHTWSVGDSSTRYAEFGLAVYPTNSDATALSTNLGSISLQAATRLISNESTVNHVGGNFIIQNRQGPLIFMTHTDIGLMVSSEQHVGIGTLFPIERLTIDGSIALREQSATPAAQDGYGKIFVSSLQNHLHYMDEHGVDHDLIFPQYIDDILASLDGYHSDVTGQEHYNQHSEAIQFILKDLDGYEPLANLDERVTTIQLALDGYGTGGGTGNAEAFGVDGYVAVFSDEDTVLGEPELFWEREDGYLGIGTTAPTERLTVDGTIAFIELPTDDSDPTEEDGKGKLYVNSKGKLYFRKECGRKFDLTAFTGDVDGGGFLDTLEGIAAVDGGTFTEDSDC